MDFLRGFYYNRKKKQRAFEFWRCMVYLVIKVFPLCAIFFSTLAALYPEFLRPLGGLIVPLLGFIMFCMGATLSLQDFVRAIKKPRAVLIGLMLQFTLMPFLAYVIAHVLGLSKEHTIGLIMVGTVAGGTASNVITYLAKGDVALSITMTATSTVAGIFLTPLVSALYLGKTVDVPAFAMFTSIFYMVALPVGLGLFIHHLCQRYQRLLNTICPLFSVFGILFVIAIIVSLNAETLHHSGLRVLFAVMLHNLSGMTAGLALATLLKCDRTTAVTIAIEVGMQNSGLAAALSKQFFGPLTALPGAIFSIWHNLSGALFASFNNKR